MKTDDGGGPPCGSVSREHDCAGKVMFNVKASNIVIRGFRFKDTEVPDSVAVRATWDATEKTADRTVEYGFPGITIRDYLAGVYCEGV